MATMSFPVAHWRQIWLTNPLERLLGDPVVVNLQKPLSKSGCLAAMASPSRTSSTR